MKIKNLIKLLQAADPEREAFFTIGGDDWEYREACAKVELASGECLEYLEVQDANINQEISNDAESIVITINLKQFNYGNVFEAAEKFDKLYKQVEQ